MFKQSIRTAHKYGKGDCPNYLHLDYGFHCFSDFGQANIGCFHTNYSAASQPMSGMLTPAEDVQDYSLMKKQGYSHEQHCL